MIQKVLKNLSNLPGWKTDRKILIIESDDWGSIRMPSNEAREILMSKNVDMGIKARQRFTDYDTLATAEDLSALYETLSAFKDKNGKNPVVTAVSVVANPDFDKIRDSGFSKYYYEPFTKTLERYGLHNAFDMWKEGIKNNLFIPQFHGREHLNVQVWLRRLQQNDRETIEAFNQQCWGYANKNSHNIDYQAAFDLEFRDDIKYQEDVIREGLDLFEDLHGYRADFFVPPNGPFNNHLEKAAAEGGVKFMSGSKIQNEPQGEGKFKKRLHWMGQKNKYGQRYITRNCAFEPSDSSRDWVSFCLNDIENAFKWNKAAVISAHRVNFTGGLDTRNRDRGLSQLNILLKTALQKWPDIEFLTSSELGKLIIKKD